MSRISDIIEEFIKSLLKETNNGILEIKRNELADYFNCAPSQINYVLKTRFNTSNGFYIESRRGGGGYVKIIRVDLNNNKYLSNIINNNIEESITKARAYNVIENCIEKGLITAREGMLMKTALSDRALNMASGYKNQIRARILKDMLLIISNK
ncbi:CtsR family transcriptional regulator [Sporosalibacterium faouarense]|uniref:CtsR family transcriptional regulator n=1 Tax=Sporosalibacterium faouarense TaxID=516123 RepID=UPI00141D720F|nr:CtsR family transcriptional regulator [Sporosalibacterium faouarense]MTI48376.1 CtsR family transcriptional regulator [Bacillota bacterium]